jgi:hypothetical protein
MKRKFFGMLLMGAMTIASVGMFTSCKDYDDDINNLQKQIDGITAQNLQSQLTTLQGALTTAQGSATAANDAAKAAKSAADAAAEAAKKAQGTADEANAAAEAATKLAQAAQATADAAAKASDVKALEDAIKDLQAIVDGKVSQAELAEAIKGVEAKIAAIDEKLLTLDDVKKLLDDADFAKNAVIQDLIGQINALNEFKKSVEAINPIGDAAWKKSVDDAIASLEGIKSDIAAKADAADVKDLQDRMKDAEAAVQALNDLKIEDQFASIRATIGDIIEVLNIYVARDLKSIVLRPDVYYGGIEGVSVYTYLMPEEKNEKCNAGKGYHYFERVGELNISDYGLAQYHVNPTNVDLSNFSIDFYNWHANIKEPVATERTTPTRSGVAGGITPVYTNTDDLLKANADNLKDGILTVPFTADAAAIEANLKKGIGTIASLSLTKVKQGDNPADTTVNSDYAIVVPEYGYGLLIGDNTFPVVTRHLDQIGYDGGAVNSSNLHRSFSFLALATTSPTHTIKYDESFDITKVLESRYVPLKDDYVNEITDTISNHTAHTAIAKWFVTTLNKEEDGDASIDKDKVVTMSPELFKKLGLTYEIVPVDYTLGSNKTGETVHLELITNEEGHVIAYPRNVTAAGETIKGQTANPACVGRQPIVCIMVKKGDKIVSFAYMKFLITPDVEVPEEAKEVAFEIKDEFWVNCEAGYAGKVTWSEVEYHIFDQLLGGVSKETFDKNYIFDYYDQTTLQVEIDNATLSKVVRKGVQYESKGGKRIDESKSFGTVDEEWNLSAQNTEDATTHIIKWAFTSDELTAKAEELKKAGKLEDKGDYYANKDPFVTWVRYAHHDYDPETDKPAIGAAPEKGNPSIWVKLTIPAGAIRVAKGDMGANKILTFWYDLNSKTNATSTKDAYEVRVNVPVPVPETSATVKTIGYSYITGAPLDIRYDNLLEKANDPIAKRSNNVYTEFTKNLKDFFIDGKLSASVKDEKHFGSIKGMKLGCEFVLPSTVIGNATFDAGTNHTVANSWTVKGYTGAEYTLILNADHTKIQIKAKDNTVYPEPVDLITLNYDENAVVGDRQITVLNYVNGVDQDDILNYKTHNELAERETFTAYINIKAVDACAPVYWDNMWFNVRFLRPLDLENPKQGLVPDAPNDWHVVDLTDALIVKDWREYYGDRLNRTGGQDVSLVLPSVGNQKAFDYAYYQVELDITENVYYTDANLGTSQRSDNYTLGHMPVIESVADAKAQGFILTSQVPNLKLEKIGKTTLRYLNNSGVTGGFHVFVPITMTYVYGFQTVRQTKWVTVGVTASVEQAMFE